MHSIRAILVALAGLLAMNANSAFHLWRMTEIYSNADGSVQFLELATGTNGEGFVSFHTLTSTVGGVTRTYTFPTDLGGQTANTTMLIATPGFAALGVVTPDYIVPNGFFSAAGGTVNFADVDVWEHPALPSSGGLSLARDGSTEPNSPRNFAGRTGTVAETAALNFEALWYKSPAESESGWGVNVAHQGDILFVTWFTYDLDGGQMWLVGPDVRRTTGNNYAGALYRTTGPAFNAVPFGAIAATAVGTAAFSFTDAGSGTFNYTVNGVTQSKAITRQVFATPPTCTAGGSPGATPNFSDLWYRSPAESEPGWGVNLAHQGDILFVTWFTYDAAGRGMWVVGPNVARTSGNTFTGALYRTTGPAFSASPWSGAGVAATQVGTATFAFTDGNTGTFSYTVNTVSQVKNIMRQSFAVPATVCR